MKKLIQKITLIIFLIIACSSASAVFTDIPNDLVLLHCDEAVTNWWGAPNTNSYWLVTPDDNSSGRDANLAILNMTNAGGFYIDNNTIPALLPGSPYGGNFFRFDKTNSSIFIWPGWVGDSSVFLDFSFRWLGLPPTNDNYAAVFGSLPWRCYFRSAGDDEFGFLQFLMEPGDVFFPSSSPKLLTSNVWYDVHFSWFETNMILIIGNSTEGYYTNTAVMTEDLSTSASQVVIGYGLWLPRHFVGDLDEIRYGWEIPEPCLFIIGYLSFIIYYRRK